MTVNSRARLSSKHFPFNSALLQPVDNMTGDGGSGGEAGGFDAYQLDDLRKFAVGFNDEVGDAFAVGRD